MTNTTALTFAAATLLVAALLALVVWPFLRHQVIYPGGRLNPDEGDPALWGLPDAEQVRFEASDGVSLHGWWVPASVSEPCGAVVYFHGNANTIAPRAWLGRDLARLGVDVLLFDYRGYGVSEGRPSADGLRRDARAAWSYVVEERGVAPERLVLFGHSLGSAVATQLAMERPAAGLIVGAPFPDFPTLFGHHAPWLPLRVLPWRDGRYDVGSRIDELRIPVLMAIAENDEVIPPDISRTVYDRAPEPRRLVTVPAEHATLVAHPEVWRELERFLEERLGCGA